MLKAMVAILAVSNFLFSHEAAYIQTDSWDEQQFSLLPEDVEEPVDSEEIVFLEEDVIADSEELFFDEELELQ